MKLTPSMYLALGIILLAGLFIALRPKPADVLEDNSTQLKQDLSTPGASTASDQLVGIKAFDLVIKNKQLTLGPELISVKEGDNVSIRIVADEDEELHLHGYDKSVDIEKDKPAVLEFRATLTGRFPYELEKSKTEIGTLEVQPK